MVRLLEVWPASAHQVADRATSITALATQEVQLISSYRFRVISIMIIVSTRPITPSGGKDWERPINQRIMTCGARTLVALPSVAWAGGRRVLCPSRPRLF